MKKLLPLLPVFITAIFFAFVGGIFYGRYNAGTTAPIRSEEVTVTTDITSQKVINGKINVNTATFEDLLYVPGIGEVTANNIIAYRDAYGPFVELEDLENVSGIGPKKLEQFAAYLTIGG